MAGWGGLLAGVVGLRAMEQQADWEGERPARWLRWHATTAPIGILAVTVLLVGLAESSQWRLSDILDLASRRVELGALGYAVALVLAERTSRVIFWALDQRRQWRNKWRREIRNEFVAELREAAKAEEGITLTEALERLSREVEASGNGAKGK